MPRTRGTPTPPRRALAAALLATALAGAAALAQATPTSAPDAVIGAALVGGDAVETLHADLTLSAAVDRYWTLLSGLGFAGRVVAVEADGVVYRFTGDAAEVEAAFSQTDGGVTVSVTRV